MPLRIDEFYAGRQVVYPSREEVERSFHVIDADVARYFFELQQYYRAFEQEFNFQAGLIRESLAELAP